MGASFADRRYWTVWAATLIFFGAFYTLLVPLPRYLDVIGLPDWQIGLILGAFGIASLFGRPLAGAFTDRLGSRPVILFGTAALTLGAATVSLTTWPPALFLLRILQAAGYVTFTTATTALIARLAPEGRRGAAIGLFGVAANVAMTITPATVSAGLAQGRLSLEAAFWLCAGLALFAGGLVWRAIPHEGGDAGASWRSLTLPPKALAPVMLTTWLFGVGFGAFYSFLPLLAERRGLEPVGLAYGLYGLSIIATRLLTGRLLDRRDRTPVLVPSLLVAALGLVGFAGAQGLPLLLGGAALMAVGSGVAHPALIAASVDRVSTLQRGRGTAAFYLAFDLGIGLGAWLLGPVLEGYGLFGLYMVAAAFTGLAAVSAPLIARTRRGTTFSEISKLPRR